MSCQTTWRVRNICAFTVHAFANNSVNFVKQETLGLRTNYEGLGLGRLEEPLESGFGGAGSGFEASFRNRGKSWLSLASTSITGGDDRAAFEKGFFAAFENGFFAIGIRGFFAIGVAIAFSEKCFEVTTCGGFRAFIPCLREVIIWYSDASIALCQTTFAPCELGQY